MNAACVQRFFYSASAPVCDCRHPRISFRSIDLASDPLHGPFPSSGATCIHSGGDFMKQAKWISVLMLLFVQLIAAAQMQPTERIVTQVPFKFMVGNVAMPSGECTIQLADEKGWVLVIRTPEARVSVFTLAVSGFDKKAARDSAMVF